MRYQPPPMETWVAILDAYRLSTHPDHKSAAVAAGVSIAFAKYAWFNGWPKHGYPAIVTTLEAERVKARAKRRQLEQRVREQTTAMIDAATDDTARSRALAGLMVRDAQGVTMALLSQATQLADASTKMLPGLIKDIESASTPGERLTMLRTVNEHISQVMSMAKQSLDMEEQYMGQLAPKKDDLPSAEQAYEHLVDTLFKLAASKRLPAPAPKVIEVPSEPET